MLRVLKACLLANSNLETGINESCFKNLNFLRKFVMTIHIPLAYPCALVFGRKNWDLTYGHPENKNL
jgi:hypothetical protein